MTERTLDESEVACIVGTMAPPKVATAEDVAAQVVAPLSPVLSGHVTGQVVTVAGGTEGRVVRGSCSPAGSNSAFRRQSGSSPA